MKAVRVHRFGDPSVLGVEPVPEPVVGADDVLVKVVAAGVNPVDAYIRTGTYTTKPSLPYTPGTDSGGTVVSVGPNVTRFKPGDRVYTSKSISGTAAELALCAQTAVHPVPPGVTFEQGAALGVPYATAYRALHLRAQARAGETILIHGASGTVGTALTQMARGLGMVVIGTAGSEAGLEQVKSQGADHVLNHRTPGHLAAVNDLTGGRGVDLVIEMLANQNLPGDLDVLARGGRVVVVGSRGPVEIDPRRTMSRDSSILGMSIMNATPEELATIHAGLYAGLAAKVLRPVVGRSFSLEQAAAAHEAVTAGGSIGKIILTP